MTIATIAEAQRTLTEVSLDVAADMGEEAVEAAWSDLVHNVAERCEPEVAAELLRREGLTLDV